MNIIQKLVDGGLLVLAVGIIGAALLGLTPRPTASAEAVMERFIHTPGSLICDVGTGPKWDELKASVVNIN